MCIRDSGYAIGSAGQAYRSANAGATWQVLPTPNEVDQFTDCLLYTSDAADERSSVDLGGRRIIKKKKRCSIDKIVMT